jgi:hypothetical protein
MLALVVGIMPASAKNGAPSRLFPYFEEDTGVLVLGQVAHVGSRTEIVDSGDHYQFLLSTGIPGADITDGRMIVAQLYCCGGRISEDQAIWAFVPPGIIVEREDLVEIRMGRVPSPGAPGVVNTVAAVRQKAAEGDGPCRWEPDSPSLWMRVVHCDDMEQQGWVQRGKLRKLWFRPAGAPDLLPAAVPAAAAPPAAEAVPAVEATAGVAAPPAATVAASAGSAGEPAAVTTGSLPDGGVVYVYHLSESSYAQGMGTLALRRAMIFVDDRKVASLTHGTHARIEVPPGPHTFTAKVSIYGLPGLPIGTTTLDVEQGSMYYLHYFEQKMGVFGGYVSQHMLVEDAQTGAAGVQRTRAKPVADGD